MRHNIILMLLASIFITFFFSCDRAIEVEDGMNSKEPVLIQSVFSDSLLVMYHSFIGSDNGAILEKDTTLKNTWFLESYNFHKKIKQTNFTFIDGKDSVYVNGIIHIGLNTDYQSGNNPDMWKAAITHGHKFQYKFQDNGFMLRMPDEHTQLGREWITVGYGDINKFSIFFETKTIFSVGNASSYRGSYAFINPNTIKLISEIDYMNIFFDEASSWIYYNSFSPNNFPGRYRAFGYIMQYDFLLQGNKEK